MSWAAQVYLPATSHIYSLLCLVRSGLLHAHIAMLVHSPNFLKFILFISCSAHQFYYSYHYHYFISTAMFKMLFSISIPLIFIISEIISYYIFTLI